MAWANTASLLIAAKNAVQKRLRIFKFNPGVICKLDYETTANCKVFSRLWSGDTSLRVIKDANEHDLFGVPVA